MDAEGRVRRGAWLPAAVLAVLVLVGSGIPLATSGVGGNGGGAFPAARPPAPTGTPL
jgi:hypothetical protein